MEKIERIENQFFEKIIVTLPELSWLLNVSVRTIQRITNPLDIIGSYDHNGRYFSLGRLAEFNSYGIWEYHQVHFSRFGNLKNTLVGIIDHSPQGMEATRIREVLGVDTRSFLSQYKSVSQVKREKLGGHYVYFSSDQDKFSAQRLRRMQTIEAHPPLKGTEAIDVLVAALKHPGFTAGELSEYLHQSGTKVKPRTIQDFFRFHGLEKKTPD
jgi:hypothetical protein